MNYLDSLSTYQQMSLFAGLFIKVAIVATLTALWIAYRQNSDSMNASAVV